MAGRIAVLLCWQDCDGDGGAAGGGVMLLWARISAVHGSFLGWTATRRLPRCRPSQAIQTLCYLTWNNARRPLAWLRHWTYGLPCCHRAAGQTQPCLEMHIPAHAALPADRPRKVGSDGQ